MHIEKTCEHSWLTGQEARPPTSELRSCSRNTAISAQQGEERTASIVVVVIVVVVPAVASIVVVVVVVCGSHRHAKPTSQ